jgi:hypothetical protein
MFRVRPSPPPTTTTRALQHLVEALAQFTAAATAALPQAGALASGAPTVLPPPRARQLQQDTANALLSRVCLANARCAAASHPMVTAASPAPASAAVPGVANSSHGGSASKAPPATVSSPGAAAGAGGRPGPGPGPGWALAAVHTLTGAADVPWLVQAAALLPPPALAPVVVECLEALRRALKTAVSRGAGAEQGAARRAYAAALGATVTTLPQLLELLRTVRLG